ncbi:DUF3027 domain-containing protein [Micromonospora sp. WMMD1128]|uniref:DUF3027 domain-containing protein n=1 Tax=Micromonospora sp. WMMD1128 TaxID=3015150 RepID=UPI00248CABC0|nr:DUF3027 domain-containing protein [Micromonospora sp. WMMD1128]WBB73163.1 DUF3027 domain-containing protein [Micromonospora sp. WMMD1128]
MGNNGRVTRPVSARAPRLDQVCAAAVEVARDAITEVEPTDVGDHLQAVAEGDRVVTHYFDCRMAGYRGWRWAVTVTRVARSKHVTICETVLLPGPDALLAPGWLPWQERLQPGDLGPGDLITTSADDERLAPGYLLSDDPAVEETSWELGLGRARVLSREGRAETAQRWYDGDHGPDAAISTAAPAAARCGTCGFYLPLAGSLRQAFGACGNFFAPDDGRVVSADHGCGAHSETLVGVAETPVDELPTVYDDSEVEAMPVGQAPGPAEAVEPAKAVEPAEPAGQP